MQDTRLVKPVDVAWKIKQVLMHGSVVPGERLSSSSEGPLGLDGIVSLQVIALETHDVPDQQLPVLCGHSDEAGMKAVRITERWGVIKPQDFDRGFEMNVIGEEQREREDFMRVVDGGDLHTDTTSAEADGFLSERGFSVVRFDLNTDGQNDGDAIIFAAFSS